MANWYCSVNGQQFGPAGEEQIKAWLQEARIGPNTLVWTEGMAGWQPLSATPLWQGVAGPPPATPPAYPSPSGPPAPSVPSVPSQGRAIAGMVLGIWSLVFSCAWPLTLPAAIVGLVLSRGEVQKARRMGVKANGLATAGMVCSIVALVLGSIALILFFARVMGGHHHFHVTGRPFCFPR